MKIKARRGLTLPEVLVTLAIIAVVAAVLVPSLTSQLSKGDAGRVSEDLKAIQTGVGTFVSDIRRYPASLNQIVNAITTAQLDLGNPTAVSYTTGQVNRWKGPYFVKDILSGATTIPTGFGGLITTAFTRDATTIGTPNQPYVRVSVTGLISSELDLIDGIIDDGVSTTGLFRNASGTGNFYVLPMQ